MGRSALLVAAVAALAALVGPSALARPTLTVSPPAFALGATVTFAGEGFRPGRQVVLLVGSSEAADRFAAARADARGVFRIRYRFGRN